MADKEPDKIQEGREDAPREQISETQHTLMLDGQPLEYTATAATIVLREEEEGDERKSEGEKPKASIFFVAYTLRPGHGADDVSHRASRPITFCFNGGPGSSSVWLHLGLLGPRRVPVTDERDRPLPPPFRLVDNAHSLLDWTDLVFIDPVSTGYSRVCLEKNPQRTTISRRT
jgi:carboxypeptidase C (cathepsin A)